MLNLTYGEQHIIVLATDKVGYFLAVTIADSLRKSTKNDIKKRRMSGFSG